MKTVWYDITELQDWQGHLTGIQRVIFNIGLELSKNQEIELKLFRYDRRAGVFTPSSYTFEEHTYVAGSSQVSSSAHSIGRVKLKRLLPSRLKRHLKAAHKKAWSVSENTPAPLKVNKNDLIFIPGAFWTGFLGKLERLKEESGASVIGTIYDLSPIVTPQYHAEVTVVNFKAEIDKALAIYDKWLSISENSKKDLQEYANTQVKADVIRLGANIDTDMDTRKPELGKDFPDDFILMVSTVEARKNQALLYQVIKLATDRNEEIPAMILVGKHGWLADDLAYILRNDPALKGKLLWLDKVDDKGLRWLYQNCLFTVYPSYYEGWGLPVSESLAYGKFCIASSSSSIPEAGGEVIEYHSPYSSDELLELIIKYNDQDRLRIVEEKIAQQKAFTWQDTGHQVANMLSNL